MSRTGDGSPTYNQSSSDHISATDANLDEKFQAAIEIVTSLPADGPVTTSTDEKLAFYSLFKQATIGPCNTPKPSFWNVVEKFKWDAWNNLGSMSANEAKAAYVLRLLKKIKEVNKGCDTGDWMQGDLGDRLLPKFAVIGLYPCDRQLRPKNLSDDEDASGTSVTMETVPVKRPETIGEEELLSDGSLTHSTSDVEYLDAVDDKRISRASSVRSSSTNVDPDPDDRSAQILKQYTSRIEGELKVISRQISHLSAEAEHRHCSLRNMFKRATLRLFTPQQISWKTIVILIVWPFIANMLLKMFRNLIGV